MLPLTQRKETRAERYERILSGDLGHKLKRASELHFDYEQASRIANGSNQPEGGGGVSSEKARSVDRSGYRAYLSANYEGGGARA